MRLIVFDIDGTLLDSVGLDDACFIQTFWDCYQIDLEGVDWTAFPHVTDCGLTNSIFKQHYGRLPTAQDIAHTKQYFYTLLEKQQEQIVAIPKALAFLKSIEQRPNVALAIATGGWFETAQLKCQAIGLDLNHYPCQTANDHHDRAEILRLAIHEAAQHHQVQHFESVLYFGDGLWDWQTTQVLGIDFIGVDYHQNKCLQQAGVAKVVADYTDSALLWQWIEGGSFFWG